MGRMKKLMSLCGEVLLYEFDDYSLDNCLDILRLACISGLVALKSRISKFIARNIATISQNPQFFDLPMDAFCKVLSENCLRVTNERQVLSIALRWLYQSKHRMQYVEQVLSTVRLATINFSEDEVNQLKTSEQAFSNPRVQQMLDQAMKYRSCPAERWSLYSRVTAPRVGTGRRQVLAAVSFSDTCAWIEEKHMWIGVKNRFYIDKSVIVADEEEPWNFSLDVACCDKDVYLAVWDLCRIFKCSDFPSGIWKEECFVPFEVHDKSLIAVPGFLYLIGGYEEPYEETLVFRLDLASGIWDEIAPLPTQLCFACSFFVDNKIYVFEEDILFGSKICPDAIRGLHVLDVSQDTWQRFDDPREDWTNTANLKVMHLERQRPACVKGKVFLSTSEGKLCTFDLATFRFELDNSGLNYSAKSAVYFDDKVARYSSYSVVGLDPQSGKESEWPDVPLWEEGEPFIIDVEDSEWNRVITQVSDDGRMEKGSSFYYEESWECYDSESDSK